VRGLQVGATITSPNHSGARTFARVDAVARRAKDAVDPKLCKLTGAGSTWLVGVAERTTKHSPNSLRPALAVAISASRRWCRALSYEQVWGVRSDLRLVQWTLPLPTFVIR
jgi:hypothetical protein